MKARQLYSELVRIYNILGGKILMRIIELSNGVKMPIIGFGTIGQFGKH